MFKLHSYFLSCLFLIVASNAFGQAIITLDESESGNQEHIATEKVRLLPGYSYAPSGVDRMRAYIRSFNFIVDADTVGQEFTIYNISGMGVSGDFFMQSTDTFELSASDTVNLLTINFTDTNQVDTVVITIIFNENYQIETAVALIIDGLYSYKYSVTPYITLEGDNIIFNLSELILNHISTCVQYNDYHWVSNKNYDENGVVIDEGITYTDNIGRSIQSQVRNFSTNKIMATENIYDSFGRLAINTLSAPTYTGAFCYISNFITANGGSPYDASKFDLPNTSSALSGEIDNPYAVDATTKGTLGWYFSNDNDEEPYVATSGFPYSRVEYYSDPLGRPKRMAGISENYKMGSGHESKIFYSEAGFELSYVYNNNNNSLNKISKTISVNADGLEKIEYTDGLGNVRATCYSGIDDGCMDIPIKHELPYYSQRSVDVHVPNFSGQVLKWYFNTSRSCVSETFVDITLIDLITEKVLIENTDYVIDGNNEFDFSGGNYANKSLYLRIQYDYTDAYIGSNGTYYTGNFGGNSYQAWSGNNFPSQSFGYILDYSHWTLNYYDEKGNITKVIPPEGVDCNGNDPSIGYASETHWEDYKVYNSSSYPYNPAYAFTYYDYNENNSAIFTDQAQQTHKIELALQTKQYIPNYTSGDPCDDGLTGTFEDQADLNLPSTEYVSANVLEYLSKSGTYNLLRIISSDSIEDSLRLQVKLVELYNDSIDLENRIIENLSRQTIVEDEIDYIDSLISNGPYCLDFDGINDYMETPTPIVDQIADGDFTFEANIKGDESTIGNHPILFCNSSSFSSGVKFFFHDIWGSSSYKMLSVQLEGVNYFIEDNGTYNGSLLDNTCHHVAISRKGDSLYFYTDGALFGKKAVSGTPDISTGLNLRIGSDRSNTYLFEGIISDVRIWNTALPDTIMSEIPNVIVSSISPNLIASWDMNEGVDTYIVNEVTNDTVQLGSSSSSDSNDPQWVSSCCNDSVATVKLEYETIMLEAALDKLNNEDTTLNELLVVLIDTVKAAIKNDDYYPVESSSYIEYMFVRDGEILSDSANNMRILPSGTVVVDPGPNPDPTPPLDPCYNKPPRLIAKFHFQLELLVYDGSNVGYVQPNGSVSSTPYSYSIYPELYKTCECDYYWNQLSLTSIGTIVINDQELNDYPDGIRFNIKNITVAKNNGYFLPFDANDGVHKFAQYLHFFTYMTHSTAPKVNDDISHSMETTYEYDVLNQLVKTTTPDAGITENVYDIQGNVRFSQDAQQEIDEKFSYVNYDRAGRPIESGVYDYSNSAALQFQNQDELPALNPGETSVLTVIDEIDGLNDTYCSEQTFTLYDLPDENTSPYYPFNTAPYTNYKQKHLLGRVSKIWNENSIMWYSYDMYGRVVWTIEYIIDAAIADYKTIDYEYDAAGNVTKTIYQKYDTEYFEHRYAYNNGQQLIKVETRTDGAAYDQQANYSYYQHGGLKRTEVGDKLQGIDYLYTIDGKLKAINSPNLGEASGGSTFSDPGLDGEGTSLFYTDIFGMTIDYHTADYIRAETFVNYGLGTNEKYSGTINQIRWNTDEPALGLDLTSSGKQNVYQYSYNDFNWITGATFGEYSHSCSQNTNTAYYCPNPPAFTADVNNQFKISGITYDKNGNIETFVRNGNSTTGISMDDLDYHYATTTQPDNDVVKINNRLTYVTDAVGSSGYTTDIETQSAANYAYNAIGEAIASAKDDETYTYYQSGLPKEIKTTSTGDLKLKFEYNTLGQRLKKTIYDGSGNADKEVFYITDASGNLISTYERDVTTSSIIQDYSITGTNLLGMYDPDTEESRYFMYDHLGNVRATFRENTGAIELLSVSDFYAFGMAMPGRNAISTLDKLNLSYQGKELDQTGFHHFGSRQWDARLGRWITTDPANQFYSPYLGMGNMPVTMIDPDGEFITWSIGNGGFSIGLNFGIGGFGLNFGWGNGGSFGAYGELGPRLLGDGSPFSFNATVSQSLDYNYTHNSLSTTTSLGGSASVFGFNAGAGGFWNYDITNDQSSFGWGIGVGVGIGNPQNGIGLSLGYGSGGLSYGFGGYFDPTVNEPPKQLILQAKQDGTYDVGTANSDFIEGNSINDRRHRTNFRNNPNVTEIANPDGTFTYILRKPRKFNVYDGRTDAAATPAISFTQTRRTATLTLNRRVSGVTYYVRGPLPGNYFNFKNFKHYGNNYRFGQPFWNR